MRPIPRTDDIFSPAAWAAAEAAQAAALARVAMAFGALDERLRAAGVAAQGQVGQSRAGQSQQGLALRLALTEASDLSWRAGDRVSPDRLALWHGLHLAGVQDDAQALTRAGWALRRLAGGRGRAIRRPSSAARRRRWRTGRR